MFLRHLAGFILALLLCAAAAGVALAQSADVSAALTKASKLMQQGVYVKAVEMIDTALKSGKVPSELAAKALLMRAEANEKLGRNAFALADYNNSLWMQGLSAGDRKRAEDGHARVMKGLGLTDPSGDTTSPGTTGSTPAQPPRRQAASNTNTQQPPSVEKTGGTGGFFSNLFGTSPSSQRADPPPKPPATAAAAIVAQAPPPGQPPKATAPQKPPAKAAAPATARAPAGAAPAKPAEAGNFAIQFAAVSEEDKAIAETDRIARKFGADLGGRPTSLMIVPTSDGGTLYKVVAGPFETRGEGQATCELLKTKGVSCMVITKK